MLARVRCRCWNKENSLLFFVFFSSEDNLAAEHPALPRADPTLEKERP